MTGTGKPPFIYFRNERTTLWCGRWEDVLPHLSEPFDLIITSPPYNLGTSTGGGLKSAQGPGSKWNGGPLAAGYAGYDDALPFEEYVTWQQAFLTEAWSHLQERGAIFYNHKPRIQDLRVVTPLEYVPRELLAYNRQNIMLVRDGGHLMNPAFYIPAHEWLVLLAKRDWRLADGGWAPTDVWRMPRDTTNAHPAPFHPSIPTRAIRTTKAYHVLDPHAGSGTTLVAAQAFPHVRTVGIEPDEFSCEMAVHRLAQLSMDLDSD